MKIGIVVPKLAGGGAEYVASEWATYLSDAGLDVVVITTERVEEPTKYPFRVVQLDSASFIGRIWSLRQIVVSEDLVTLIGLMPYWNLLVLAAGNLRPNRRVQVLISSHTIESSYGVRRRRSFALQMILARIGYRFSDAFIASSHPVAAEAVARYGISRERLWVIPNPVFPRRLNSRFPSTETLAGRPSALVVPGRLVDQKRPSLAIAVAAALSVPWGVSPEVIFVGEGPAHETTSRNARDAGIRAVFRGWDPEWPSLVPRDSVVLLPSMLEGFGNVLLDAAAAGLPVVVSSRALGSADALLPGITGELVSGDGPSDFVKGVLAVSSRARSEPLTIEAWLNRFTRDGSGAQLMTVIASSSKMGEG